MICKYTTHALGWAGTPASPGTTTLNAANARYGIAFTPEENITVAKVRLYVGTKTASPSASDAVLEILNEVAATGLPDPASVVATSSATDTLATATWSTFTISANLTAGTRYWLSVKNVNGTPATNYWTMFQARSFTDMWAGNSTIHIGVEQGSSTDAWSTITTPTIGGGGFEIEDSGGAVHGNPIESGPTADTNLIYDARETGALFKSPVRILVRGVRAPLSRSSGTGTINGTVTCKLYPALGTAVSSAARSAALMTSTSTFLRNFTFSTPVMLEANVQHRISFLYSINDSTYNVRVSNMTYRNDTKSLSLKPWAGTCTYTYFDSSTWANNDQKVFPFLLLCDPVEEFRGCYKPHLDFGASV